MNPLHLFVLVALLGGCAANDPSKFADAATTPLGDLNLVQAPIPPALAAAQKQPYAMPAEQGCAALAAELRALDEVLGPDLDAPPSAADPGLVERGSDAVGSAAVGAVRGASENLVPFRGWVRKLSGAERYSRDVAAAIVAGGARRGFLRGVRAARGCA
jgi:hypothetical protein